MGAKDFRAPGGLGVVQSQFCYVVILQGRAVGESAKYFRDLPAVASGRHRIWRWSARLSEEPPPITALLHATQIGRYLLISNRFDALRTIAERLDSPASKLMTLRQVRQWEILRDKEYWGYRRYRREPTTDEEAAALSVVPPDAEALTFFLDSAQNRCVLRLFRSSTGQNAQRPVMIGGELGALQPAGGGVWETTIPLAAGEETLGSFFVVMGMFGFGVYL